MVDTLYVVRPRRAILHVLRFSNMAMVCMYCSLVSFGNKPWKKPGELNKKIEIPTKQHTKSVFNAE